MPPRPPTCGPSCGGGRPEPGAGRARARGGVPRRGGGALAARGISACDVTRAQPRHLMIPVLLEELDGIVDLDDVVILVATGTPRPNTDAELRAMFGDEVVDAVRIVNHDSRATDTHRFVGTLGDGVPVWL